MSDQTLIALSREVAALTVERDRLQQENKELKAFIESGHAGLIADNDRLVAKVQALEAAASWQPIATAPHNEDVIFWVMPKAPDEAYTNTSGEPIIGVFEPYAFRGKWKQWSALSKATHWRRDLPVAPPAASRREEEK